MARNIIPNTESLRALRDRFLQQVTTTSHQADSLQIT